MVSPIIINLSDYTIISGHQRFDVLFYENNVQEVYLLELGDIGWVFTDTDLILKDKNHEKALNLAMNRIHGEFDLDKVHEVLFELEELKLDYLTGFDLELDDINYEFSSRIGYEEEDEFDDEEFDDEEFELDKETNDYNEIEFEETIEKTIKPEKTHKETEKESNRIRRGFIKYGDIYKIGDSSYLMFGKYNNEQDRTKLLNINSQNNNIDLPKELKKIKTINKEITYYISDDAELIENILIENNQMCRKV